MNFTVKMKHVFISQHLVFTLNSVFQETVFNWHCATWNSEYKLANILCWILRYITHCGCLPYARVFANLHIPFHLVLKSEEKKYSEKFGWGVKMVRVGTDSQTQDKASFFTLAQFSYSLIPLCKYQVLMCVRIGKHTLY